MLKKLELITEEFQIGASVIDEELATIYLMDGPEGEEVNAAEIVATKEDLEQIINLLESVVKTLK